MSDSEFSVVFKDVYKHYFKNLFFANKSQKDQNKILALDNLNFQLKKGEVLGIIGHNGAGKSTLLKVIAGIASITSGTIKSSGKICSLLNLSAGLNMFQTGRENIYNLLKIYGQHNITKNLVDEVIAFSNLEDFIDQKIYTYSSGMRIRLAFSICISIKCDILLLDEAIAVGDEFFSIKSFKKIHELTKQGITCIITSHDWTKIFRISTKIMWLEKGKIKEIGLPREIIYKYLENVNSFTITNELFFQDFKISSMFKQNKLNLTLNFVCLPKKSCKVAFIIECLDSITGGSVLSSWSLDNKFIIEFTDRNPKKISISYEDIPISEGEYHWFVSCVDYEEGPFPTKILAFADFAKYPELIFKVGEFNNLINSKPLFNLPISVVSNV